ncbi:MAG: hypothetical protein WC269_01450 [Candidatus Gracilibacteria bacterium]|jgi:predicted membrane protein
MTLLIFIAYFLLGVAIDALASIEVKATADLHLRRMIVYGGSKSIISSISTVIFFYYFGLVEQSLIWMVTSEVGTVTGSLYGSYWAWKKQTREREEKKEKRKQAAREKSKGKKIKVTKHDCSKTTRLEI